MKLQTSFLMFIRCIIFALCLLFFTNNTKAQIHELIQVKGIVANKKLEPVSFAHIIIKNKKSGFISDEFGKFDFFCEKGDTLQFSCVGYKKAKYIVPAVSDYRIYYFLAILQFDTLLLPEVLVFPWKTYYEFKTAFLKSEIPEDDIDRAEMNFALIQLQMITDDDDMPSSPGASYNLLTQQRNSLLYWKGQNQPNQLLNYFAWANFFDYLKNGKFKRKQKR